MGSKTADRFHWHKKAGAFTGTCFELTEKGDKSFAGAICFELSPTEIVQFQSLIVIQRPADIPFAGEQQKAVAFQILNLFCV